MTSLVPTTMQSVQKLVCRMKGANEDFKTLKKMFFINNREAHLRGSISSEPRLPARKWGGVSRPLRGMRSGRCPEDPAFQAV